MRLDFIMLATCPRICGQYSKRSNSKALALSLCQRTRMTPSTYVYTSFVSNLVLVKSVTVAKTPRQTLLFNCLLYWPHIAWARCHYYEIKSTLRTNRVHDFQSWHCIGTRPSPDFCPLLQDEICEWPGNKASLSSDVQLKLKPYKCNKCLENFCSQSDWY